MNSIKEFWEKCNTTFSHCSIDNWLKSENNLYESWDNHFLLKLNSLYDLRNSTVIDYGTGGGFLGKHLFNKFGVKKYIGIDIAERQLNEVKKNLSSYNIETYLLPLSDFNLGADVFITQAVIQHFPNQDYFLDFCDKVNRSNSKILMIQIRSGEKNKPSSYLTEKEVVRNFFTKKGEVETLLKNYKLVWESDIKKNGYHFLIFKIK